MEWISVEERLPEENTDVLVYAVGILDGFIGESTVKITNRGETSPMPRLYSRIGWREPGEYFFTDYKITHWMPLPEPPKPPKVPMYWADGEE